MIRGIEQEMLRWKTLGLETQGPHTYTKEAQLIRYYTDIDKM